MHAAGSDARSRDSLRPRGLGRRSTVDDVLALRGEAGEQAVLHAHRHVAIGQYGERAFAGQLAPDTLATGAGQAEPG